MAARMDRPGHERQHTKSTINSKHERKLSESSAEKRRFTSTTKANPNAAMEEAQPIAAALEKPTLQSLRSFQHTDSNGNPIAEPDLSNPTRSRWERPLDTIRSFEAAIDNEYRRRAQTIRAETGTEVMSGYASRRSSYYGGGQEQNRFSQVGGQYGSRQAAAARDSWADNGHGMGGPVGPPRTRYNRMQSDPAFNRHGNGGHHVYPSQGYQQSRDTVNTGGSGSQSDPYSTDPSSENSSIERATPVGKPDLGEQYGFQGFGGNPIMEEYSNGTEPSNNGGYNHQQQYGGSYGAPPVPRKGGPPVPPHNPNAIKLTNPQESPPTANAGGRPTVLTRNNTEKRKSWFKRRFSKD